MITHNSKNSNIIGSKFRLIFQYGLLVIAFGLTLSLISSILTFLQSKEKLKKEELRVEALKKENLELKNKISQVESRDFIEKMARDNLGFAYSGESIIILPDKEIVKKVLSFEEKKEDTLPDPNWKKWMQLFF